MSPSWQSLQRRRADDLDAREIIIRSQFIADERDGGLLGVFATILRMNAK